MEGQPQPVGTVHCLDQPGKRHPVRRDIVGKILPPIFGNRQNLPAADQLGVDSGQLIEHPALGGLEAAGQLGVFPKYFKRRRAGCRLCLRELQVLRDPPPVARQGREASEQ